MGDEKGLRILYALQIIDLNLSLGTTSHQGHIGFRGSKVGTIQTHGDLTQTYC